MSVPSLDSGGLTPVNSALEPSWVRDGSTQVQQDYQVAQGFEQVLMQQLSSAMTSSGEGSEEEGGEGEGGQPGFSSLLPQALSQGVTAGGGMGLAAQLTRDMLEASGDTKALTGQGATSAAGATGATSADSTSAAGATSADGTSAAGATTGVTGAGGVAA